MTLIVGLGHQSGVGKDTSAAIIRDQLQARVPKLRVALVSFFETPKDFAADIFGMYGLKSRQYYEIDRRERHKKLPVLDKTPNELWIEIGRSLCNVYKNVLIDSAIRRIAPCEIGIIRDVRLMNEVEAIAGLDGLLVKVENPRSRPLDTLEDHYLDSFTGWHSTIVNDGDMDCLRSRCEPITDMIINSIRC